MIDFEIAKTIGKATAMLMGIATSADQLVTRDFDISLDLPNSPKKVYIGGYVTERVGSNVNQ